MNTLSEYRSKTLSEYSWLCDGLFAQWIIQKISPYGDSILDVGCGNGFMFPFYQEKFKKIAGVEPSKPLYEELMKNSSFKDITLQMIAAEELAFNQGEFDVVLAKSSLHHFVDVSKALKQIGRVSKNIIGIAEVVAPSDECITFLKKILIKKEVGRQEESVFTETSLRELLKRNFPDYKLYQLHYDQYINVNKWLKYSDLRLQEQEEILQYINKCDEKIAECMQIHFEESDVYMLRRMCLNIVVK